jgi:hypothetical protein
MPRPREENKLRPILFNQMFLPGELCLHVSLNVLLNMFKICPFSVVKKINSYVIKIWTKNVELNIPRHLD